jgi:phospholipid/cholesterol/gamma-HCH transport system substrate-binding protein
VNYAAVGTFVLVLGAALIAVVLWLASGGAWQKKYDFYQAVEDESVAGLNLNAPVKYQGVDVGRVREIRLDRDNPQRVNLVFAIEQGTPIKEDTVAVLKTQGLTGIAYVELDGGSAASAVLQAKEGERYPRIRTKPSLSARLETVLTNVLGKLDNTANNIDAMLSTENRVAFSSALGDFAAVAHTLAARRSSIDLAITQAARTLDNTARISAQAGPVLERVGRGADALQSMGQSVAQTSNSAGKTVDAVGSDVKRFGAETVPELERVLGELSVLAGSLRRLSDQTERDPSGLLFGRKPTPPGPGEKGVSP